MKGFTADKKLLPVGLSDQESNAYPTELAWYVLVSLRLSDR